MPMRKLILAFAGLALIAPNFAAPALAQSGGWPIEQDDGEYVADQGPSGKGQDFEVQPVDPDQPYYQGEPDDPEGVYYPDEPNQQRRYQRGDTYRGDGQPWQGEDGQAYCRRSDGTTGTIIGGGAGALIGRGIDTRGRRGTGTILGALAGALIGRAIERGQSCR
jgi:hypothetical protein